MRVAEGLTFPDHPCAGLENTLSPMSTDVPATLIRPLARSRADGLIAPDQPRVGSLKT
ncbi:MAG TPA: hypothetical protein VGG07_26675 [Solirubrobacteraceae bacterium]